jgi:putative transposase
LGVSRQAFGQWAQRQQRRRRRTSTVLAAVRRLRVQLPRVGTRKLQHLLTRWGPDFCLGRDALFDLLRREQLLIRPLRRHIATTRGRTTARYPNLCQPVTAPEQCWVADITYLRLAGRFRYLALIMDRYSRFIVGYHVSHSLHTELVATALQHALALRQRTGTLIHHSDRGTQYDSDAFARLLHHHGLTGSMTQRPDPYENAQAERVIGILKYEFGLRQTFQREQDLRHTVETAIFRYNFLRPHQALQMQTPARVHRQSSSFP